MFAHLDALGDGSMLEGCIRGIEDNWFQGRIADSAYELERTINDGRRTVVGVSAFTEGNDSDALELLQITHEDEARQLKRLEQVRHDARRRRGRGHPRCAAVGRRRSRGQPDAGADRVGRRRTPRSAR